MMTKRTAKNQITLPKPVIARFPDTEYFEVTTDGITIILRPLQRSRADAVRSQLAELGIAENDVQAALDWARNNR